jgi:sensor histidine kinase YesM
MTKKTPRLKQRKGAWFAQIRGSYIPVSWQGWLTYIPFVAYLVYSLAVAFDYTGNGLKAILWIVPNWVAATVIMTWVAKRTS